MESMTDFFAIVGWAMFGFCLPTHLAIFRQGTDVFGSDKGRIVYWIFNAVSFGFIAASLVIG